METMGGENLADENKNHAMNSNDMQPVDQAKYESRMQEGEDPGMSDKEGSVSSDEAVDQGNYRAKTGMADVHGEQDIGSGQSGSSGSMEEESSGATQWESEDRNEPGMHGDEPAEGSRIAAEGPGTSQQQMGTTGPSGNMQMTGAEGSGMPEGGVGMSSHTSSSSEEGGGRISSIQVQEYLSGVNYPAIKQDMLDTARSNKAPEEVMYFMNRLPEKTYNSPNDVEEEFGKIQ